MGNYKNTNRKNSLKKRTNRTKRRSNAPWAGWSKYAPKGSTRTKMMKKCGEKCFLGPKKSFPICSKNTCKINSKGVYAAYVRSRQWGKAKTAYKGRSKPRMARNVYQKVAKTAKKMLKKLGFKNVGKSTRK